MVAWLGQRPERAADGGQLPESPQVCVDQRRRLFGGHLNGRELLRTAPLRQAPAPGGASMPTTWLGFPAPGPVKTRGPRGKERTGPCVDPSGASGQRRARSGSGTTRCPRRRPCPRSSRWTRPGVAPTCSASTTVIATWDRPATSWRAGDLGSGHAPGVEGPVLLGWVCRMAAWRCGAGLQGSGRGSGSGSRVSGRGRGWPSRW